jgi:hypothetical protein
MTNGSDVRRDFRMTLQRMTRHESRGVPEIDLWMAGDTHVFRRVAGVLDSGCSQTLLRRTTADMLSLPRIGTPITRRSVGGPIRVYRSRLLVRFELDDAPPLVVLLPVNVVDDDKARVDMNLFGTDLVDVCPFRIEVSRQVISIVLVEES